jgi:hypothetical protein
MATGQNRRTKRKTYPYVTLYTKNPKWTGLQSNLVLRWRVTNGLRYGWAALNRHMKYHEPEHQQAPQKLNNAHWIETYFQNLC